MQSYIDQQGRSWGTGHPNNHNPLGMPGIGSHGLHQTLYTTNQGNYQNQQKYSEPNYAEIPHQPPEYQFVTMTPVQEQYNAGIQDLNHRNINAPKIGFQNGRLHGVYSNNRSNEQLTPGDVSDIRDRRDMIDLSRTSHCSKDALCESSVESHHGNPSCCGIHVTLQVLLFFLLTVVYLGIGGAAGFFIGKHCEYCFINRPYSVKSANPSH